MILVIAEKPSLGRDIADALPGAKTGGDRRYIKKGDYVITWVFGGLRQEIQKVVGGGAAYLLPELGTENRSGRRRGSREQGGARQAYRQAA